MLAAGDDQFVDSLVLYHRTGHDQQIQTVARVR